ncbi:MAG: hypothetical protein GY834_10620 [Bacteroidetes bacterium]|nr:hypothetical protein [Bacteroidota bacterium]
MSEIFDYVVKHKHRWKGKFYKDWAGLYYVDEDGYEYKAGCYDERFKITTDSVKTCGYCGKSFKIKKENNYEIQKKAGGD